MPTEATGTVENVSFEEMQKALQLQRQAWAAKETVGERFVVPREGKDGVSVILYRPRTEAEGPLPVFVNMHGGAWVGGDAVLMESFCQLLADEIPAFVVNVNYVKGDVQPLPYAHQEVVDTVCYFAAHADEYGIDPAKMMVGGHSAGANLAAGAAWKLAEDGYVLAGQVLVYVAADLTGDDPLLTQLRTMLFPNGGWEDPLVSPGALAPEALSKVAPAIFILCGKDDLRPGAIAYAKKLIDAGVPVKTKEYAGAEHGFLEVNRPDYDMPDDRKTPEQEAYTRDCEQYLIREMRAML